MSQSNWTATRTGHGTTNHHRQLNGFTATLMERNREYHGVVRDERGRVVFRGRYATVALGKSQLTRKMK